MSTRTRQFAKLIALVVIFILSILIVVGAYMRQQNPKTQYGNLNPDPYLTLPLCERGITGLLAQESGCQPNP